MTTIELRTPAATAAGSRSASYALLCQCFRFPSPALYELIVSGELRERIGAAVAGLPYPLGTPTALGSGLAAGLEELQQEYVAAFDVGGPNGSPCYLYEGEFGGGRMKVLEDVLRFYHYFGAQLSQEEGERDRPDHLATELSFLHALTFAEAELLEQHANPSMYRRAQRDFLKYHAGDLVRDVFNRIGPAGIPFFSELAVLSHEFCQADLHYLANA